MVKKTFLVISLVIFFIFGVTGFSQEVVANTDIPLATYFARIQVNPLYQMCNMASIWFGEQHLKGTEYEDLPIISRQSTTFGGFKGADDFLYIPSGELTNKDIEKIYRYSNTIQALKLNGKQIIEWLEASAENFHQIDPKVSEDQRLINYGFDTHLFDQFWGITYMFDVTKPVGERVVEIRYEGKPLIEDMEFIIMTDNYRAGGGGGLPHAVPENVVLKWDTDFRELIIDYLNEINGDIPELVFNWSIKPIETKGTIILKTGGEWGIPVTEYMEEARELNIEPVSSLEYVGTDDVWGLFSIDLSKMKTPY